MTECCYGHDPCPELARYQAALARVRALCDDWDREYTAPTAQVDCYMRAAAYKIRAALDGVSSSESTYTSPGASPPS